LNKNNLKKEKGLQLAAIAMVAATVMAVEGVSDKVSGDSSWTLMTGDSSWTLMTVVATAASTTVNVCVNSKWQCD